MLQPSLIGKDDETNGGDPVRLGGGEWASFVTLQGWDEFTSLQSYRGVVWC